MSSFALTLYLGTDLKRAMEKEEITGTHAEKLGSCGPCLWWRCTSSSQETQLADFIIEEAVFLCLLRKELAGLASLVWESSVAVVSSCKQQAVGSCGGYFTHGEQGKALPFPSGWPGESITIYTGPEHRESLTWSRSCQQQHSPRASSVSHEVFTYSSYNLLLTFEKFLSQWFSHLLIEILLFSC